MSDWQIEVKNLSKAYDLESQKQRGIGLKGLGKLFGFSRSNQPDEKLFWALKDVSFSIRKGERVGIIGANGAGKSTLLKLLSRISYPTTGEAKIRGRVGSLLELGAGFNDELSGRDNIYLNASLYGLSHAEIESKFDEIVSFSGVGKFIDTPLKHYSSGMRVRLGFAVAVNIDPDVLMLDEVLAVGDITFQQKCLNRVSGLTSENRTLLFVSHSLGDVARFCERVIWLEAGRVKFDGDAVTGLALYQSAMLGESHENKGSLAEFRGERKGTGAARFNSIRILNQNHDSIQAARTGQSIVVELDYKLLQPVQEEIFEVSVAAAFENDKKQRLFTTPSEIFTEKLGEIGTQGRFFCHIEKLPLVPGVYTLTVSLHINRQLVDKVVEALTINVFEGDFFGTGRLPVAATGQICIPFSWKMESNAVQKLPGEAHV